MYTYKNKTDRTLVIPNVGVLEADGEIKSETLIENPNIELVSDGEQSVVATATPQPAVVSVSAPENLNNPATSEGAN